MCRYLLLFCLGDLACLSRGGNRESVYTVTLSLRTVADARLALEKCTSSGS